MKLRFLCSAYCVVMFFICTKFNENMVYGFKVMERTWFPYYPLMVLYTYKSFLTSAIQALWVDSENTHIQREREHLQRFLYLPQTVIIATLKSLYSCQWKNSINTNHPESLLGWIQIESGCAKIESNNCQT